MYHGFLVWFLDCCFLVVETYCWHRCLELLRMMWNGSNGCSETEELATIEQLCILVSLHAGCRLATFAILGCGVLWRPVLDAW